MHYTIVGIDGGMSSCPKKLVDSNKHIKVVYHSFIVNNYQCDCDIVIIFSHLMMHPRSLSLDANEL